jgi:ankyrin repeat protein
MANFQELTQERIREFVTAAHGDLPRVKAMLREQPDLLNSRYLEWDETALEAASHMGDRAIAEYLLAGGAPLTICTAAMLGQVDQVQAMLEENPDLANATGAHQIPVLFHAALSGRTEVGDLLLEHGCVQSPDTALHAAVQAGQAVMVRWLLARGADSRVENYQGKTPLEVAEEHGETEIAELLRDHRAREE